MTVCGTGKCGYRAPSAPEPERAGSGAPDKWPDANRRAAGAPEPESTHIGRLHIVDMYFAIGLGLFPLVLGLGYLLWALAGPPHTVPGGTLFEQWGWVPIAGGVLIAAVIALPHICGGLIKLEDYRHKRPAAGAGTGGGGP